jgi:hypothetical protein
MRIPIASIVRSTMLLLLGGLLLTPPLAAQTPPPRILSYQGVLSDSRRTAVVDGTYSLTFRIYDVESGGTPLWEEKNDVQTIDGIFETILGSKTPLLLPFDKSYWIALQLQGEQEMTPRVRFVSSPYSFRAFEADNAMQLDTKASGVVHSLNALDGNLVIVGQGEASVKVSNDTLAIVVPRALPSNAKDGQLIRWNGSLGAWEAFDNTLVTAPRLAGSGTSSAPLDIAQMGATDGQHLVWDDAAKAWKPGTATVHTASPLQGDGTAASPIGLQKGTGDHQVMAWDATSGSWKLAEQRVVTFGEVSGTGTTSDPIRLAQQGSTDGQVLRWDSISRGWRPGPPVNVANPPLAGAGSPGNPLRFTNGTATGQLLYWNGTQWGTTTARAPQDGELLRWNAASNVWEPAPLAVSNVAPLNIGAIWYGNASGRAAELPPGQPRQLLTMDASGSRPAWTSSITLDSINVGTIRVRSTAQVDSGLLVTGPTTLNGPVTVGGATTINGDLTVNGGAVNLPAGSISNATLANSSINLTYATGVAGDASVALGGALALRNTGVTSIAGTPKQVIANNATGSVTLSLPQDIDDNARPRFDGVTLDNLTAGSASNEVLVSNAGVVESRTFSSFIAPGSISNAMLANSSINLTYGAGVAGDASVALGGTLALQNTGVTSIAGTANQVIANNATGSVTLSLPQNIDNNATPRFDGITLDNLSGASASDTLLVSNGGQVQSRTVASLIPVFAPLLSTQVWTTTGNAGTTPGTNFLGTTDNQALQLHVNNTAANGSNGRGRVMRFEPNDSSANIIGGFSGNSVAGTFGATIAGGGRNGSPNTVSAPYGTISGGYKNSVSADLSAIGGGAGNAIGTSSTRSTIAGGHVNTIGSTSSQSTIGGGRGNYIRDNASQSTIGGGVQDTIYDNAGNSVISGGTSNSIAAGGNTSTIAGGSSNKIGASASTSVISGGSGNTLNSTTSVISGGDNALIGTNARWATIGGGHNNKIFDNSYESTIGAGEGNTISAVRGTVGGGSFNVIAASSDNSTIGGGYGTNIRSNSDRSTIGGGMSNTINPSASIGTIAGGFQNTIDTSATIATIGGGENNRNASSQSTIAGGESNVITSGSTRSTIGGGMRNYIATSSGSSTIAGGETDTIQSSQSAIGGGSNNVIGTGSTQSVISGGASNRIGNTSAGGTISGGTNNAIGDNVRLSAIAGGRGMTLNGRGSFGFMGGNDVGTHNMTIAATDVAVFGNTDLWLANNDNAPSQLRFYSDYNTSGAFPNTAKYTSFQAPTALAADIQYVLPGTSGNVGDQLTVSAIAGSQVTLGWAGAGGATPWSITGNTGTTPGTNYIGTNDDQAFEIHIGNSVSSGTDGRGRVMRYETNATSANIIGGYRANSITAGVTTATIAGGGQNGAANTIASNCATISGGRGNTIGASSINATIAGGVSNAVTASAGNGTISGGLGNVIVSGDHTTIGGGFNNRINTGAFGVVIGGGTNNQVSSHTSVIGGGNGNIINTSSQFSTITGGNSHSIGSSSFESVIVGGTVDTIETSAPYSSITGGTSNAIRTTATRSTIGGGYDNEIGSGSDRATIGGGEQNRINAGAYRTTISGGMQNVIDVNGRWGTIGGGEQNYINGLSSVIAGGTHDTIENGAQNGFIGGGDLNAIRASARYAVVAGGRTNQVLASSDYGVVSGGQNNVVSGSRSAIAGGEGLTLSGTGSFGFLGGNVGANSMSVSANNTTVLGNTDLWLANNDNAPSQLRFYSDYNTAGAFPNGTHYVSLQAPTALAADIQYTLPGTSGNVGDQLTVTAIAGSQVTLGWAAPSDRRIKTDFLTLDGESILQKFRSVDLGTWRYMADPAGHRHYGIMAQDFKKLFGNDGRGEISTDTTVNNIDMMGVSYLAIQGLEKRTSAGQAELDELRTMINALRERVESLEMENRKLREEIK